jgi:hypothetical protein
MRNTKNASVVLGVFFVTVLCLLPNIGNMDTVSGSHSVSVSAVVQAPPPPEEPKTIVRFTGFAYSNSELTILRNGTFLANTSASSSATFDTAIEMNPGTYTFSIHGKDPNGTVGPTFNISVTVNSGVTLTITGIFLGPTIEVNKNSVKIGDNINFSGYTVPNSTVTLFINPETNASYDIISNGNGYWSKSLIAGENLVNSGTHQAYAKANANGDNSENSKTLNFFVTEETTPNPCDSASPADLNCDGRVNLVDFSILMFYWQEKTPANSRADINRDGLVDIIDFSIMMFYWTG